MNSITPPKALFRPTRFAWLGPGEVLLHNADERFVRGHAAYADAKAGDREAAFALVDDIFSLEVVTTLAAAFADNTLLLPVVAEETEGTNAIPLALASRLSLALGWHLDTSIIQANVAARTRRDGYYRLAIQPMFDGPVQAGREYLLVDDFIGQGATLANLRGHVIHHGGQVRGYTSLTGKPVSATLALQPTTLTELRRIHGQTLEDWWQAVFGFGFEAFTESEARYLIGRTDAQRVRNEVTARLR